MKRWLTIAIMFVWVIFFTIEYDEKQLNKQHGGWLCGKGIFLFALNGNIAEFSTKMF